MVNKALIVSGFIISVISIFVVVYLIRKREDLTVADITEDFVNYSKDPKTSRMNTYDAQSNVLSVTTQEYLWTPINDGINKAYVKLSNDLAQNVTTKSLNVDGSFNLLPTGIIVAWTGSAAPTGWYLCDGTNGTPNLSGRFILGSGTGTNLTKRDNHTIGGVESVALNESQIPAHNHDYGDNAPFNYTYKFGENEWANERAIRGVQVIASKTANKGGNQPHDNMPPYYVLAYIMKA